MDTLAAVTQVTPRSLEPTYTVGMISRVLPRRRLIWGSLALGGLGLIAGCGQPPWQARPKVPRIGFLGGTTESAEAARVMAFREGLRELGYAEGQTIAIEW